jgi:4-amino-4-deoxy-L-arabinose transferase-like glycosyltransferase
LAKTAPKRLYRAKKNKQIIMIKVFKGLFTEKNFIFLLLIIVILGSIPRAIEIISGNFLFGYDQGVFFQAVKNIVVDHKLTLIGTEVGGKGGFFQGPLWYYLLAIPFFLTHGNPYGAMVLMFAIGISVIALCTIIGKKIFGFKAGLAIGALIALSPAVIAQSRFIWPPFVISLLSVFVIYFIYKILQGYEKYFFFLMFTVGLMFHFETATGIALLLQILIISSVFVIRKMFSLKHYSLGLLSFFLTQINLFLFDLRHNFINAKGIINLLTNREDNSIADKVNLIFNHVAVFKSNFISSFQMSNLLWPVLVIILTVGLVLYLRDRKVKIPQKLIILYLFTSPLIIFIIYLFYSSVMWEWWILELTIFYCFLFGVIFVYLLNIKLLKYIVIAIYIVFLFSFAQKTIYFYKNDFNDYGGTQKIKGKIEAIDYIYKDAANKQFGLLVFTPPVYTYAYDYLVWWHGYGKYGYNPYWEKRGTLYLLIEPDSAKPWSYKGWLETVVKTGTILKTKELPSGFIIQKRSI